MLKFRLPFANRQVSDVDFDLKGPIDRVAR